MPMAKRPARSRQDRMQETREALLEAGLALFAEQGLDGPSLDAICERAGYTRGAFYVHFEDRDDFLVQAMDRVGRGFLDALFATPREQDDLGSLIGRFVESMLSGSYPLTREGGVRPHQLLDACARSRVIRERYVALVVESLERVSDLVASAQREGVVRADVGAREIATILLAAVIGAQSMIELEVPLDVTRASIAIMGLLMPDAKPRKRSRKR